MGPGGERGAWVCFIVKQSKCFSDTTQTGFLTIWMHFKANYSFNKLEIRKATEKEMEVNWWHIENVINSFYLLTRSFHSSLRVFFWTLLIYTLASLIFFRRKRTFSSWFSARFSFWTRRSFSSLFIRFHFNAKHICRIENKKNSHSLFMAIITMAFYARIKNETLVH